MKWIKRLSRGSFLVLLLPLLAVPPLLIGSGTGEMLASILTELGPMITALIEMAPQSVQRIANEFSNEILGLELVEAARKSLSVLVAVLISILIGLGIPKSSGKSLYDELMDILNQIVETCWNFITGKESWVSTVPSFLKAGIRAGLYCIGLPSFLFSSYDAINTTVTVEPSYVVAKADSHLLPVQLVVHFDNAATDIDGELTERGTSLDHVRKTTLEKTMKTLARCVTPERDVIIQPYGFASDDPFRGWPDNESDSLNVQVANRRAKAVHQVLADLDGDVLKIKMPKRWTKWNKMVNKRNSMILVPKGTDRDPFSDRVVLLFLSNRGNCDLVEDAPQ